MLRFLPTALLLSGALLLALALAGCGKAAPLYCDETTPCTDPDRPFCDLAGVFPESDGHGRTCIADPGGGEPDAATACVADTVSCDGDTLVDCGPDGSPRATETCPLGCKADEARCLTFLPSNGVALDGAEDGPDLTLGDGAIIDTTEGTITDGNGSPVLVASKLLPALQGGVEIRVFQFKTLTLGDTTVIGQPALALVSAGDLTVGGRLRLERTRVPFQPGLEIWATPGGFGTGCGGSSPSAGTGGGGGFGKPGGNGGSKGTNAGGAGGPAQGAATIEPLRGGCYGPNNGVQIACLPPAVCPAYRGVGGGAIQLASGSSIALKDGASIEAPGFSDVRSGGGSGGGILIEAPKVDVGQDSIIAANGAGGGIRDGEGEAGTLSATPARGAAATCDGITSHGGNGGSVSSPAIAGDNAATDAGCAGSGGGGVGRIRINSASPSADIPPSAVFTPAPRVGVLDGI